MTLKEYIFGKKEPAMGREAVIEFAKQDCVELEHNLESYIGTADAYRDECLDQMQKDYSADLSDSAYQMATNAAEMDETIALCREQQAYIRSARIEMNKPMLPDTKLEGIIKGLKEIKGIVDSSKNANTTGRLLENIGKLKNARALQASLIREQSKKHMSISATVEKRAKEYLRTCEASRATQRMEKEGERPVVYAPQQEQLQELKPME